MYIVVYIKYKFQKLRTNINFKIKIIPQCTRGIIFRDLLNENAIARKWLTVKKAAFTRITKRSI